MKTILFLGATGRVGTLLRRCWEQEAMQYDDVALTFQTRSAHQAHSGDLVWDILDPFPSHISDSVSHDCMIVLAGVVPAPHADLDLNTSIGLASIQAAAQQGIPRVLLASSSAVYGNYSDAPLAEDAPLLPVNDYGHAKRAMEDACHAEANALGIALCCLRIGNVAGADALLRNGAALEEGETLTLDQFADGGTPVRSYIGPHSFGRVLLSLARSPARLPPHLNVAAPHPVSMHALAQAADMPVTLHPGQNSAHQHITLDCTALTALHRFDPVEEHPHEIIRQWRKACA
jgi:nucleoside-diphosphate-sugar epimerase